MGTSSTSLLSQGIQSKLHTNHNKDSVDAISIDWLEKYVSVWPARQSQPHCDKLALLFRTFDPFKTTTHLPERKAGSYFHQLRACALKKGCLSWAGPWEILSCPSLVFPSEKDTGVGCGHRCVHHCPNRN